MPYIPQDQREITRELGPTDVGHLNYNLSQQIDKYIAMVGLNYESLNGIIGVLECMKLEVYRRIAAPYEDRKIEQNGEVFTTAVSLLEKGN